MSEESLYIIRDPSGAIYGPGNIATVRQWIGEGRITPQMLIAPQGSQNFIPASQLPELAGAFSAPANSDSLPATANPPGSTLPNTQTYSANSYMAKSSGLAIASLVCSLCGIFCGLAAIAGIIMGHIARGQIRREPDRYDGMGMATAGTIIGYCIVGLCVLFVVGYLLIVVLFVATAGSTMR